MPSELEILETISEVMSVPDFAEVLRDDAATQALVETLSPCCHPAFAVGMIAGGAGLRQDYAGLDGFIAAWRDWVTPFQAFRIQTEDEITGEGDTFVGFGRQVGVLEGGAEVKAEATAVFRFEDGLLIRLEFHMNRAEALRSAGLG